ncbi:Vacuolar protein-sorting-associated protein 27 [Linnemannia schmuckeri]|uniref:Vacuolar protein sorting-associated protein 27 n=1 Tax=Linnemannia schmuckeri TaxID=64567 RepID=A0A9P5RVA7_9FUNG|nr:Vacuolar protein-sorting-associated protein 27 [Linnemannia schmuckeri]
MSWLWSASPIDELVDKATSENLPAGSEDLALNLEICDQIRSKQVSPKDAAKALKRRIGHKNPNVQMLALGLTDVCVKNGGHHFLVEIAAREFIDNLTSILKAPAGCNLEVKNRILGLIQTWGLLFRGKHGLGYVCDTYMILQHEGFQFPPKDNVGAALVESEAPPDWTDSDVCTRCRSTFTLTNRKHHCRACGSTFCGQCSSKTMALPNMGVTQEVRVCDGCWMKKKLGPKSVVALESHGLGGGLEYIPSAAKTGSTTNHTTAHSSSKPSGTTNLTSAASRTAADDDADLLKAIELSLKESQTQTGYSAPKRTNIEPVKKAPVPAEEEEDADLLAAIEASLRETNIRSSSSSAAPRSSQRQSSYSSYTYSKKPIAAAAVSQHELTETEKSNIEMFSVLVDRIQMMQGDVAGNREVQALYEQISKLQMKVALSLEEAARKQQEFVGFNDKIDHAVRIYDHLLQERLNSSYQRRMNTTNYAQPGVYNNNAPMTPQTPQASHIYPQMSNPDSRYAQYVPSSGPYGGTPSAQQTPQIPFQQTPYQQQQQQPQHQQQQPSYPYQPNQIAQSSGAPVAYNVTSPVATDQQPYSTAPAQQNQYGVQQQPQQPIQQQPQTQPQQQQQFAPQYTNGNAAPMAPMSVSSPIVQSSVPVNGQLPINNGYQPMGQAVQSPPQQPQQQQQSFAPVAQQSAYVPYDPQQQQQQPPQQQLPQQQQQPLQAQAPVIQPQFSGSAAPVQPQYAPYQQQQQQQQQAYAPIAQPKVEEAPLIEL